MVKRPFRRASGGWSRSGGPLGGPRVVGNGRETLPEVREWLVGPPKGQGVVGSPSRMVGKPLRRVGGPAKVSRGNPE